jgi:hypothetical protein
MDDELKRLVEISAKNSEEIKKDLAEMKKMVKSIKHHFIRDEIFSFLRFLIIVVPMIVGTIYLMPYLQKAMTQYQQLMGFSADASAGTLKIEDLQKLVSPEMMKSLENYGQKPQ